MMCGARREQASYFHIFFSASSRSWSLRITLEHASSKSSCVMCERRSRSANMPASVQIALSSAPDALLLFSAIVLRLIPRVMFILREWIFKISKRASSSGAGNSILRSMRPGRSRASSSTSIRLVAMMTLMLCDDSKPSSWLSSSSIVRCTSESELAPASLRLVPMESISSMKMMDGACSRAITKSSRTRRAPSPMYFCTSSVPDTRMKVQSVWCATARASSVLPVPGGPYSSTPLGWAIPSASKSSGWFTGSSITSLISLTCFDRPPISSYVLPDAFSTRIRETSGSTLDGRMACSVELEERRATRVVGVSFATSMLLSTSTTCLPWPPPDLTSTLFLVMTRTTSPTLEPLSCSSCTSSLRWRTRALSSLRCASRRA
mmetsp:Transcript_12428/g.38671  ORF Transcript_12428/g.38671 Transcript_12428/m.38671 type:complete len:378 (+) Transcript_12428:32-1165(+)